MNKLILFIGIIYLASVVISGKAQVTIEADKAVIVNADDAATSEDVNTRLFTNDANTNNAIASGLLGVGLGIGGTLTI